MKRCIAIAISLLLMCSMLIVLWQFFRNDENASLVPAEPMVLTAESGAIQPIPLYISLNEKKVKLGEKLFHDLRLSHDNSLSCASCHNLLTGGADRTARSVGIDGAIGAINAPTVFNSGFNFKQFWDGRAETLTNDLKDNLDDLLPVSKYRASFRGDSSFSISLSKNTISRLCRAL